MDKLEEAHLFSHEVASSMFMLVVSLDGRNSQLLLLAYDKLCI